MENIYKHGLYFSLFVHTQNIYRVIPKLSVTKGCAYYCKVDNILSFSFV